MNGIINLYKEPDFTSFDVVAKLRGILKQKKIGHTGTLDPAATGVLPVCLGNATKLCDMLTDRTKEYRAVLLCGITTDTLDTTGTILTQSDVNVSEEDIRKAVQKYTGTYEQIPPMYSALKVDGKRLYELAREGKEVERKGRTVTIFECEIEKIELPRITLRVSCSKGTYIRSLCDDIGRELGCGGAMEKLVRTRSGRFSIDQAYTISEIEKFRDEGKLEEIILPVEEALSEYKKVSVKPEYKKLVDNGNPLPSEAFLETPDSTVRVYNCEGEFFALYTLREEEGRYYPDKVFPKEV